MSAVSRTDAKTSVEIKNNLNSATIKQNSTSNVKTRIRIETNGNVKVFESDNASDVHLESDDGTAKVNIKNNTNGTITQNDSQSVDNKVKIVQNKEKVKEEIKEKKNEISKKIEDSKRKTEEQNTIVQKIQKFIRDLISGIFS